jgi:hypothetical protein
MITIPSGKSTASAVMKIAYQSPPQPFYPSVILS